MKIFNLIKGMLCKKKDIIPDEICFLDLKKDKSNSLNITIEQFMLNKKAKEGVLVSKVFVPDSYPVKKDFQLL